ncbi:MAG: flagellar biosynthesis anti-sigma factor FlgM [Halobacteriovoraceae bacterium]|nr:flagellar biosynthesis anti-sigma factor FlgM [Halobacteriovoraceae bacterium]
MRTNKKFKNIHQMLKKNNKLLKQTTFKRIIKMNKINNTVNPFRLFSDSNKSPKRTKFFNEMKDNNDEIQQKKKGEKFSSLDAKVTIPEAIKDFARIKRVVDESPDMDNQIKVEKIKDQIKNGSYKINYDLLAEKMLENEI